jgi:hypothetical protein
MNETCNLHRWNTLSPGQLQVSVTKLPQLRNERISTFQSRDDLLQYLLASACAFPFAPLLFHKDSWYVDGGITDFQPIIDERTITVSPFYFADVDIKPSRYVPLWWALFPPNDNSTIDWLYNLGYQDGLHWIDEQLTFRSNCVLVSSILSSHVTSSSAAERFHHPYDCDTVTTRISMHRLLGFDIIANFTHSYISMIFDFGLLCMLLFVWKPFALFLVYAELIYIIIKSIIITVIYEMIDIFPLVCLCCSLLLPHYKIIAVMISAMFFLKLICFGPASANYEYMEVLFDSLNCVRSFTLLSRFLPAVYKEKNKHNSKLSKLSLSYRIFKHIV